MGSVDRSAYVPLFSDMSGIESGIDGLKASYEAPRAKVTLMASMDHLLHAPANDRQLADDLQQWLEAQNLDRLPTLNKDGALKFLNDRGMPVRRNAVVTAFNAKELDSGIYSGKRLASEHDVMKWAVSRLGGRRQMSPDA